MQPSTASDRRLDVGARLRATLGECPVWSVPRQSLLCVDIMGGTIFEIAGHAGIERHDVGDYVSAIVPAGGGRWLAALRTGLFVFDLERGKRERFHTPAGHDSRQMRFNDAKCDPRGRIWVGSVSLKNSPDVGVLYRIDSSDLSRAMVKNLSVPNGLAWSRSGETLYFIDSPTKQVRVFAFDPLRGEIVGERLPIDLAGTPGFPDGCTIDDRGCLWIAHWGGAQVSCWDPLARRQIDAVRLPVSQVTSCTFGGPLLDQLFITTAAHELPSELRRREDHAGDLFVADVQCCGLSPVPATVCQPVGAFAAVSGLSAVGRFVYRAGMEGALR